MTAVVFKTCLGWMAIAANARGVRAVVLPRASRRAAELEMNRVLGGEGTKAVGAARHLQPAQAAIIAYLEGTARSLDVPLDMDGNTPFQRKVWAVLRTIPYGRVRSYGWVARKVGKPQAARAVGAACGANPVPLLVPCHRVVAGDGSLGGFAGGVLTKKRLLKLEGTRVP